MNIVFFTAAGVGGATIIGAIIGFVFIKTAEKYANTVISFAAGVMLATSVFNLIIPSVENENLFSVYISVAGIFCGSLCINVLDFFANKLLKMNNMNCLQSNEKLHRIMLFVAAIAIHNLPEGIAAGVGFGTGNTADALIIAGSIALQNLPEGMVIISPMLSVGISRAKTFIIARIATPISTKFHNLEGDAIAPYNKTNDTSIFKIKIFLSFILLNKYLILLSP